MKVLKASSRARLISLVVVLGLWAGQASAGVIDLFDFGINVDGTTTCSSGGCDSSFATDLGGVAGVDDSGFDYVSGLGSLSVTITGAGAHMLDLFVDHEIDELINGFSNEFGGSGGALAAGQTAEIDEPGFLFGDIFDNFLVSALDNTNGVPVGNPDDVSMALGWDFTLAAGETAVVDFLLSTTAPTGGGFFLTHNDPDSGAPNQIFFSSVLDISGGGMMVPEPGALTLLGMGLLAMAGARRRRVRKT